MLETNHGSAAIANMSTLGSEQTFAALAATLREGIQASTLKQPMTTLPGKLPVASPVRGAPLATAIHSAAYTVYELPLAILHCLTEAFV